MRVGRPPFCDLDNDARRTQYNVVNWQTSLHIPESANLSHETINLILRLCCGQDMRLGRNGSDEIKRHPFFHDVQFDTLHQQQAPFIPVIAHPADTSNFDAATNLSKLRRSGSLDSLLPQARTLDDDDEDDYGKHNFFDFTFRRFFDIEGYNV